MPFSPNVGPRGPRPLPAQTGLLVVRPLERDELDQPVTALLEGELRATSAKGLAPARLTVLTQDHMLLLLAARGVNATKRREARRMNAARVFVEEAPALFEKGRAADLPARRREVPLTPGWSSETAPIRRVAEVAWTGPRGRAFPGDTETALGSGAGSDCMKFTRWSNTFHGAIPTISNEAEDTYDRALVSCTVSSHVACCR